MESFKNLNDRIFFERRQTFTKTNNMASSGLWGEGKRLQERLRVPSPIYGHANTTGHHPKVHNFSLVGRESHNIASSIKEAM